MDRKIQAVRPVRFYIPNLPSFLNEDDVYDPFSEERPAYVKQRIHKDFGIPSGGFFVGFQAAEKADRLVDFEGESYKMVCLDKPWERYQQSPNPSHNDPDQGNAPVDPILKMTPRTRKPPRIPNGKHPPHKCRSNKNETPMDTQPFHFRVEPTIKVFNFGEIQKGDPLALSPKEQ